MHSVELDDQPVDLKFTADRHRVQAVIDQDLPVGDHNARLDYTVTGASAVDESDEQYLTLVHVRLMDPSNRPDDKVVVDESELAGSLVAGVDCVTYAPDAVPCGERTETGWTVRLDQEGDLGATPEIVIVLAVG